MTTRVVASFYNVYLPWVWFLYLSEYLNSNIIRAGSTVTSSSSSSTISFLFFFFLATTWTHLTASGSLFGND